MKIQRQSDAILRLLDASHEVEDSVTVHGPLIARRLEERFAVRFAELGDGERPNILATFHALRDEVAASRRKLSADEMHHIDLLQQITRLSLEREDLFGSLQEDYTWLRNNFNRFLGPRLAGSVAGLQGPTAVGTTKLLRQVEVAIHRLSQPDLVLPTESLGAATSNPQQIASELEKKVRRLREVKELLEKKRREAQLTMAEKNESVKRHRAVLYPVCTTLVGYYRLAGEDELADRILSSTRQRGRRPIELAPAPEAAESEPGTESEENDGETEG